MPDMRESDLDYQSNSNQIDDNKQNDKIIKESSSNNNNINLDVQNNGKIRY